MNRGLAGKRLQRRGAKVKFNLLLVGAAAIIAGATAAGTALAARDQVRIAGSSTVLPYANIVAEAFGKQGKFKTPVVESGGSGAGIKQFCEGVGEDKIDIADASRKIKPEEIADCAKAGVTDIIEVKFGYDGVVFASDIKGPEFKLEPKDVFLALAAQIPQGDKIVDNPNKSLKDVNAALPDWPITMFIPGEKHGTREVFEQKVLLAGCKDSGAHDAFAKASPNAKPNDVDTMCVKVRKDGPAVDIDGDYTETLARLQSNNQSIGVFGLSFYENNKDKLRVATVSGVVPTVESVAQGEYPVSRPLFFYIKKAHIGVIPGLKEYATFFVSDKIDGPKGPLVKDGLVPLPATELKTVQAVVQKGEVIK
jgi:phosphate transport system substrate-binding protein